MSQYKGLNIYSRRNICIRIFVNIFFVKPEKAFAFSHFYFDLKMPVSKPILLRRKICRFEANRSRGS